MRLSVEINDFLKSWQGVNNIVGNNADKEYKRLRNQHLKQQMELAPEMQRAKLDYYGLGRADKETHTRLLNERIKDLQHRRTLQSQPQNTIPLPGPSYTPNSAVPVDEPPAAAPQVGGDAYVPGDMAALNDGYDDNAYEDNAQFAASGGAIDDNWRELHEDENGNLVGGRDNNNTEDNLEEVPVKDRSIGEHIKAGARAIFEGDKYREIVGGRSKYNPLYDKKLREKKYATGGAVGDDDEDDVTSDMAVSDSDEDDTADTTDTTQVASASPPYSVQAAHDAVLDGLKYQVAQVQQRTGAVDTGRYRRTYRDAASDAINPQQMEAIFKAVDPEGKLSVGERGMAAFGHVYSHLLSKGDVAGAQKAAGGMLQYYNIQSNKWRAISRAAAENGDLNGTVKALVKSYENIPDGMDVNVVKQGDKLGFEFKDQKTGKTMRKIMSTPDEILQAATHGTLPSFEEVLGQSAGMRHQASKGGKKEGPSLRDRMTAYKAVGEEAKETTSEGASKHTLPKGLEGGVKSIATDMLHQGLNPDESIDFTQKLIKAPMEAFKPDKDGNVQFVYNGTVFTLPKQTVAKVASVRHSVATTGTPYGPEQPQENPYASRRRALESGATGTWGEDEQPLPETKQAVAEQPIEDPYEEHRKRTTKKSSSRTGEW